MAIAGLVNPVVASASSTEAGAVASCASPPGTPDATPENRDRFVELWLARIADDAWMKNFTEADTVPADILAEGFHAMDEQTKIWLNACLLDGMLEVAKESPTTDKRNQYLFGLNMVIFGKDAIAKFREDAKSEAPAKPAPPQPPVPPELKPQVLEEMATELVSEPSLTSADHPKADVTTPVTSTTKDLAGQASGPLKELLSAPSIVPNNSAPTTASAPSVTPTALPPGGVLGIPPIPQLLEAVSELLQLVSQIQGKLFTLPGLNVLASAFYKVCAESPTMPLSCSVSLPVGVPILADVTGDNVPDVITNLMPLTNFIDVGAKFQVQRLSNATPLPAHVFAVYDTPIVKKRIEFGYDGRASTLAYNSITTFTLKNAVAAATGDVQVTASVAKSHPGSTEALTFAVKSLVGGSPGVLPSEEDPVTGAVQMSPVPERFNVGARLIHTPNRDQDIFTVESTTPTKVDALVDQATTTTNPKSNRRFTATVDKLPTKVTVDLIRNGEKQTIDYTGSAPIDLVQASDTATPDISHPGSYTQSIYEVKGVPTNVHVDMQGAQDILYSASAKIPEVSFSTKTLADDVLQQQITAKAHQIPKSVHVTNLTTTDKTAVTYDADSELQDVELTMFDLDDDKTNLVAKATGIPTHLEFTQNKATGVYDFAAPGGIDLIEASLTRNDGMLLPLPGDHATVHKVAEALGVDFRLSGFASAHFDPSEDTTVELGLSPGGQSFDAIADLDDPNVLATAHVSQLPANMAVTLSPVAGKATYTASSIIPLLEAGFTKRDTNTFATAKLTDLPKNIDLTFNTTGGNPQVTYDADSRLGSIEATYQEAPGALGVHAKITDLPQYMKITGKDPISFDARTSAAAAPGSSDIGQILFQYATDGVFQSPPTADDHLYLNTVGGTHAELLYSGLAFASVNTINQELHAELRNSAPRLVRAYLTTPNLTLTGYIDKVPASVKVDQVGNKITYTASSTITEIFTDLARTNGDTMSVKLTGIPAFVEVLFDAANSKINWSSSSITGGIAVLAHLTAATVGGPRAFDAALTIAGIPTSWSANYGNGNILFVAGGAGIGSITAKVTNHGTYHVLAGDHLSAFFDQPAGDLDASLKISNLTKAGFTKITNASGGGFEADLNMGNGSPFALSGDILLTGGNKLKAVGSFTNLPTVAKLKSDGGRITYTGNNSPTLTLSVEAGNVTALAATPTPSSVHGVSLRDGAGGGGKAVKAKLFLTGLPTSLDLNSPAGTYTVGGYNPSIAKLVLDVILTTLAPQPLSLQVEQIVPTASPVNFVFGPFLTSTAGDGTHNLSLNYTANQDLGALEANATYGNTDEAQLLISKIPKSIVVNAAFGAAQKSVNITMDSGISDITASYKKVGALNFAASVHLHDVPKWVNLLIGRGTGSSGGTDVEAPDFTFTAESAGLDINATAGAEIATPIDAKAAVSLVVTNLGHTVTGAVQGRSLHITSTPATGSFLLSGSGEVNIGVNLGFSEGIFVNTGQLDVHVDILKVTLGFLNASDLHLDLGITTGLRGNFTQFSFGLDTDTEIHIVDDFDIFIDWPDPFGSETWDVITIDEFIDFNNLIEAFHINSNTWGDIFELTIVGCGVHFEIRPGPGFNTAGSFLSLPAPPAAPAGHVDAWLITPDINALGFSLPGWVLDIIAFFASPYGNGFRIRFGC